MHILSTTCGIRSSLSVSSPNLRCILSLCLHDMYSSLAQKSTCSHSVLYHCRTSSNLRMQTLAVLWPSSVHAMASTCVTGTQDQLACMPVDQGKLWEPAHIFLILSRTVSSRSYHLCLLCFRWSRVAAPLCTSSASRLVSCCLVSCLVSGYRSMFSHLPPPSITCTCCPPLWPERVRTFEKAFVL